MDNNWTIYLDPQLGYILNMIATINASYIWIAGSRIKIWLLTHI